MPPSCHLSEHGATQWLAELESGWGFSSRIVEVLVVQWVMQVQVCAITVLLVKLFEVKLSVEVRSVFIDSENNFQLKKLNKIINT